MQAIENCEGQPVDLFNAPVQVFELTVMSVADKLTLKKKLEMELSQVRVAVENLKSKSRKNIDEICPTVTDDDAMVLGNDHSGKDQVSGVHSKHGFHRQLSVASQNSQTAHSKEKRKPEITKLCNSSEFVPRDVGVLVNKRSEVAKVADKKRALPERIEPPQDRKTPRIFSDRMRDSAILLKKLMLHPDAWVFNQPVDPVKLIIPDYFEVVKKPMDLGTVRSKLERKLYLSTQDFAADVRLTFSNAMLYNPHNNDVHLMAKDLNTLFNKRWRSLEEKWKKDGSGSVLKPSNPKTVSQKRPAASCVSSAPRKSMTLARPVKPAGVDCKTVQGIVHKNISNGMGKAREFTVCGDVENHSVCTQSLSSDVDSEGSIVGGVSQGHASSGTKFHLKHIKDTQMSTAEVAIEQYSNMDHDADGGKVSPINCSRSASDVDEESGQSRSPHPVASTSAFREGGRDAPDGQLSPSKALRAAMLKSRFADTIRKAQQKTLLNHGGRRDAIREKREREEMERRKLEERAKMEAQARADEVAREQVEAQEKRNRERAAARHALQTMKKTIYIDNFTDFESVLSSSYLLENLGLFLKEDYMDDGVEDAVYF
ncbi:transcription factor GTE12 [Amborella trichopoda]|uniref:transcription factor GTE12 n=1 Tax=Amborella trichopoda TaxID=13333 RepID=UPI0005D341F4|nr:transcription factor GTE12 [Amborella trichopoda]|eukprot:XP_020528436.1 transcription factor GTE12 [Amborella trichopoda]